MEREIERYLPYIIGGMFILGVLLFLLALQQLRLRRTGQHWRSRRRAGDRGGRLFVISILLMVGSIALAIVSGLATLAYRNVNQFLNRGPDNLYGIVLPAGAVLTATAQSTVQPLSITPLVTHLAAATTIAPTAPVLPSATVTLQIASPTATIPPTTTAVLTPDATFTPAAIITTAPTATTALQTALNLTAVFNTTPRPASADAHLTVNVVSDQYTSSAPAPQQQFSAGIKRMYVYISFDHMDDGVAWSRVLYRSGGVLQGDTLLWSLGTSGSSYFFFGDQSGYPPGSYEVRLYVGSRQVSSYHFTLIDGRES